MRRLETARLEVGMWQRPTLLLRGNRAGRRMLLPSWEGTVHSAPRAPGRSGADAYVDAVDRRIQRPVCTRPARTGGLGAGEQFHLDICAIRPIAALRLVGLTILCLPLRADGTLLSGAMLSCAMSYPIASGLVPANLLSLLWHSFHPVQG